jgi:hypothetical protein
MEVVEVAMVQVLGLVEDGRTFNDFIFMQSIKLHN